MLLLLFNVGEDVYAIDAASVVEVLPLVDIKSVAHASRSLAGTFNYRGAFVPAIDLSALMLGRSAQARLSTRIILIKTSENRESRLLGLIAEKTTETMRCEPSDFVPPGVVSDAAPYLGPIAKGRRGFVQRIEVDKLPGAAMPHFLLKQSA